MKHEPAHQIDEIRCKVCDAGMEAFEQPIGQLSASLITPPSHMTELKLMQYTYDTFLQNFF